MIVDVAGDEDAVDFGMRLIGDDEIAHRVDVEPVAEDVRVRPVTDRNEQPLHRDVARVARDRVA
jgi:hypothetical protein